MITLDKSNMIRILKEMSDKFNENNIKHEIPYVYKNKKEFDHIKVIIPINTDITILSDLLNTTEYKDGSRFIDIYYKKFRFILIRTPEEEFLTQFFYYSWNILPTLMNVILNKFSMNFEPSGLRYIDKGRNFLITNNIKFILEFLDMNFSIYKRGFFDFFSIVTYITTSIYYDNKIFEEYKLNDNDFFYFDKKKEFNESLNILSNFVGEYEFLKKEDYFLNIESMFPGSNFLENVIKLNKI